MPSLPYLSLAEGARESLVDLAQQLVRIPSLTGREGDVAALVKGTMWALGYDDVLVDAAGNVLGRFRGGAGPTLLLHAHMDVVDPGDPSRWTHPPFAAVIADGHLWGRGAVDDKGSLAAQIQAVGLLAREGVRPPGDVIVAAVVGEEVGGLGTLELLRTLQADIAVVGEPSGNTLRIGHRGRLEYMVTFRGLSAHASAPQAGRNPLFSLARFLQRLQSVPGTPDDMLGPSTVVPTLVQVDQTSSNVIPAVATVHLDWRNVPSESAEGAAALVATWAEEACDEGISAQVALARNLVTAYTGLKRDLAHVMPAFQRPRTDGLVVQAQQVLEEALGRPVPVDTWRFATDGGHLAAAGVRCVGLGPGDELMAHVLDERLPLNQLVEATAAYMALAHRLGERPA